MDNPGALGIVPVALTVQVTIAAQRLEALLSAAERGLGQILAERVQAIVAAQRLGYYPALDFFESHPDMDPELTVRVKALAAQIRKRVKREVQTQLWPVFSSVRIERTTTLAFTLPRMTPAQPDALTRLAQHYFPNNVRLELVLTTLDKQQHLEAAEESSANKVVRNLRDVFEVVQVSATRRLGSPADSAQKP